MRAGGFVLYDNKETISGPRENLGGLLLTSYKCRRFWNGNTEDAACLSRPILRKKYVHDVSGR
jgi:hypothetical protein